MSEALYYDVASLLIPEAVSMLKEYEHPRKSELLSAGDRLRHVVLSAYERTRSLSLPTEVVRFREVMRYGLLSLKRIYKEGDWRSHVFFCELLYEVETVKYLMDWLLLTLTLPTGATLLDVNSAAPILSAKVGARTGAKVIIPLEERLADVSVVREVSNEYFRRYGVDGRILRVGSKFGAEELKEAADGILFVSPDSWTLGWDTMLSAALAALRPRGVLACLLPANFREGWRTLLTFWDVPPFPEPAAALAQLKNMRFRDVRVTTRGPFYAVVAQKR